MIAAFLITIYIYSFFATYGIIGGKNDWKVETCLVALGLSALPIINTIYAIKNYRYIAANIKL